MHPKLPYAKQSINAQDIERVSRALKGGWITRGENVAAFEKAIAEYVGAPFAVAFNSGASALAAAFFAADVGPFDEVVTTPNSFIASMGQAVVRGAKPRFVDIDRTTGNLDLVKLREVLKERRSRGKQVIVPVHFSGIACDMKALEEGIISADAVVIEDAAHALGSCYPSGERVGGCQYSAMTVFSFHPAKTITTGEGGMVTTADEGLYRKLLAWRNNGIFPLEGDIRYEVRALTGNFHMNEMEAALGLSQFERLEAFVEKRRELVRRYRSGFKDSGLRLFSDEVDARTAWHLMVVQFEAEAFDREALRKRLLEEGIGTEVHYIPLYRHPAVRNAGRFCEEDYPEMEGYFKGALSLPLFYDMAADDVDRVVEAVIRSMKLLQK